MSENLYGFTQETKSEENSGSKFVQAGIHEDLVVTKLEYQPAEGSSSACLYIEMANPEGQTVNRKYFEPAIDGNWFKTDADLKKAVLKTNKIIANLSRKFLGENYVAQGVTSFESLCKKVISDIGTRYQNVKLRTMVVFNTNDFPTLRSFAPIWELPSKVPVEKSQLKPGKYDKMTQSDDTADEETTKESASFSEVDWDSPEVV